MYIIIAILVFGILILVHELGHFLTAKWFRVKVNEFSIGMGPALIQRTHGETTYSLRALPIGGFCAMEGEEGESKDPRAINSQALWKRLIIFAAGAFMNFLTGFLIILVLFSSAGAFYAPVITGFAEGTTLQSQGLAAGDRIVSIDGEPILIYSDVTTFLGMSKNDTFDLVLDRDGEKVILNDFTMKKAEYSSVDGSTYVGYGLYFGETIEATPLVKVKMACLNSVDFVRLVWYSLKMLVTGQVSLSDMSGPVGIVSTISDVGQNSVNVTAALQNILYLAALIAVNLAVMNLLPLPALDGGHIFIMVITTVITKITKRPVNPKYEGYINYAGFVALMIFMVVVTLSDVVKLVT